MKREYDFTKAKRNPFAKRIKKEGAVVSTRQRDGSVVRMIYPAGTRINSKPAIIVYPSGHGWAVRKENSIRAFRVTVEKSEAIALGEQLATKLHATLIVHPGAA